MEPLRERRFLPFLYSSTSVTNYLSFEHQNSSGPRKSPAFQPYPEFLLFAVLELLVLRTLPPPPQFFCLFYIGLFQSVALSRRKLKLFMRGIMKVLLFSFSTAKSDNFIPKLAIFDPLFCSSFKVYVTDSFHYKENFSSLPVKTYFENIISINPESPKTVKKSSLKEVILQLLLL